MKQLFLILPILFFSLNVFSQRLEDKETSNLDENTLFAVQDSTNKYNWKKVPFQSLLERFNVLRTPYGNVAGIDSTVRLRGVTFNEANTVVENNLTTTRIKEGFFATNQTNMVGGFNFIKTANNTDAEILANEWQNNIYFNFNAVPQVGIQNWGSDGSINEPAVDFISIRGESKASPAASQNGDRLGRVTWGFRKSTGSNGVAVALYGTLTDSVSNKGSLNINLNGIDDNAEVSFQFEKTEINNVLHAKKGIYIAQLNYTPSSSTDLQGEAANAEIGTMWQLNVSGSWYLITKISATKLARSAFAEW